MFQLTGKIALVTGGSSGIGLASAQALLAQGARVVLSSRNVATGEAACGQLASLGGEVYFEPCDVSSPDEVAALHQRVLSRFGRLDCAVNSAAMDVLPASLTRMKAADAQQLVAVDVLGMMYCMQQQITLMQGQQAGVIVNVSSVNGLSGVAGAAMYSAAKHAVLGLTRSAALECIASGVRINAVCPGATATPRRERRSAMLSPAEQSQQQAALQQIIPIGRVADAAEIANAVLWLCSPLSSYVVGHALVVDGGLAA